MNRSKTSTTLAILPWMPLQIIQQLQRCRIRERKLGSRSNQRAMLERSPPTMVKMKGTISLTQSLPISRKPRRLIQPSCQQLLEISLWKWILDNKAQNNELKFSHLKIELRARKNELASLIKWIHKLERLNLVKLKAWKNEPNTPH